LIKNQVGFEPLFDAHPTLVYASKESWTPLEKRSHEMYEEHGIELLIY
jgi:hypothetical protein